ncbi:MAG: GerAB/ArcD/ProY family transporter [Puniceicoccales bacterium]|jgi:tyrosine-specific transport protein|nr:GerAB/ArcD/ProY family transporter [Puniceicoccales bacterium]
MNKKLIQIILFIAGNAIGAGVLGLPVSLGGAGVWPALIAMGALYGAMLYTAQILADFVLETRAFDLPSLFRKTLGKPGMVAFCVAYFTLFFCLLVAYWTGLGSLFAPVAFPCRSLLVVFVAFLLFHGFRSIGPLNAWLTAGFIVAFVALIFFMLQIESGITPAIGDLAVLNRSLSVILCSYGFHAAVPFLCQELNFNKKMVRKAIFWGTLFPFLFNIIITFVSFRALSVEELQGGAARGLPVFALLCEKDGMQLCAQWGQIFSFFAIISSLIGVSLTMGNALQDCFSGKLMKFLPIIVTVGLPFAVSICNPSIFIRTLEFAGGICLNTIAGILPLVVKIKSKKNISLDVLLLLGFFYVLIVTIL